MKYLTKKIALKILGIDKIEHSIVISDPNTPDCPMVYVSEFFKSYWLYNRISWKNCRFLQGLKLMKMILNILELHLDQKKNNDRYFKLQKKWREVLE